MNVLLIDSDNFFQKAFQNIMYRYYPEHTVECASDMMEVYEIMEHSRPEIVFCDTYFDGMSGCRICRNIKNSWTNVDLYILSSFCDLRLVQGAMASGVENYLFKPIDFKQLSKIIDSKEEDEKKNICWYPLLVSVEQRDYALSYKEAEELTDMVFEQNKEKDRKVIFQHLMEELFQLSPGMSGQQKAYYLKKYALTRKILSGKITVYFWLVQLITEIYKQLCTFKHSNMNQVFKYIEENIKDDISLSDLSKQAGISSGYLSRLFKNYYRISIVDYIHLRKISLAKYYMMTTEMNVSDISFLLGYSEAGYFCKIFKKFEKKTPSIFHQEYTGKMIYAGV